MFIMRKKLITIQTKEDYQTFLKKLNLYKSVFYRNTLFLLENHTQEKELEEIIEALNIKQRKKRITYIYDTSCHKIDRITSGKNICGFEKNQCYVQRKLKNGKYNGCCRGCLYQSKKGCTTKNLTCKLFNCSEVTKRYQIPTYQDLKILKLLSLKNQILIKDDYFATREQVLKDLYSYSLIYATMKITFRLIKNTILLKRPKKRSSSHFEE